jgi:DNA polymerase
VPASGERQPTAPRPAPSAPARAAARTAPAAPAPPAPPPALPAGGAADIALACRSLDEIADALARFDACPLQRTATHLVYMDGNRAARVLLVGEAPGREEDLEGRPFVGRSGQLLDRMLAAVGLSRAASGPGDSVAIVNTIFWRPPGNRKPTEAEVAMCLPFVRRTIALMRPGLIVGLGATPSQQLLGTAEGILSLRGRWRRYQRDGLDIPMLPTLHPAYLLRQPTGKRLSWRDMLSLREALDQLAAAAVAS